MDFKVVPAQMALVNVDVQNCFVAGSPISAADGLAVLDRINRLSAVCRDAGILVIHTLFVLRPDGSNIGVLAETSPPAKEGILNRGTESAAIHPRLVVGGKRQFLLDQSPLPQNICYIPQFQPFKLGPGLKPSCNIPPSQLIIFIF